MSIQLSKIFILVVLASFVFISFPSRAEPAVSDELKDIKESVENFFSSFLIKDTIENLTPSTIIAICIAIVVLALIFRGVIFFVIIFGILTVMFGSTEKVVSYFKEKFDLIKDNVDLKSSILKQQEDSKEDKH